MLNSHYSVITSDGAAKQIASTPMRYNDVVAVAVLVKATRSDGGANEAAFFHAEATFMNVNGVASQVGATSNLTTQRTNAAWSVAFALSGPSVLVNVTGQAGSTITWYCELQTFGAGQLALPSSVYAG